MRNDTNKPFTQKLIINTVGSQNLSPEIPIEKFYEMEPDSEQLVLIEVFDYKKYDIKFKVIVDEKNSTKLVSKLHLPIIEALKEES